LTEKKTKFNSKKKKRTYPDTPIQVIELKIESNAGNKDYTCLYKFRVHGKLFEQIQQERREKEQADQEGTATTQSTAEQAKKEE